MRTLFARLSLVVYVLFVLSLLCSPYLSLNHLKLNSVSEPLLFVAFHVVGQIHEFGWMKGALVSVGNLLFGLQSDCCK